MASDVSHELNALVPPQDLLWQYEAQPLLLLSELKPSKAQKTLQPVIDLATGQIIGVEEVRGIAMFLFFFFVCLFVNHVAFIELLFI
jgi:hypothetical protein